MESSDYMTGERRLEYYDTLRQMHSLLKDILYADDVLNVEDQNALDAVHSVLYLAEGVFASQPKTDSIDLRIIDDQKDQAERNG